MSQHKFKVIAGSHLEGGRLFNTGDVVTSSHNLVASFPGKFQDLGEVAPVRPLAPVTPAAPVVTLPAEAASTDAPGTNPPDDADSDWEADKVDPAPAPAKTKAAKKKNAN